MEIDEYNTEELCFWTETEEGGEYDTDCGEIFILIDGTPRENSMKYCCYCGDKLEEVLYDRE